MSRHIPMHKQFFPFFKEIKKCADNPCKNGAMCMDTTTGVGFQCMCAAGYTGKTCDIGKSCNIYKEVTDGSVVKSYLLCLR